MSSTTKKGRFIVHLYRSCSFENEVAAFLEACSQEDLRHLLSQGVWLGDFIESTGIELSDSRFSGAIPDVDDDKSIFYVRFASSDSKLPESRTQKVWDRLQSFSTFPGRLMFLRQIIFRGYLVENAFNKKYGAVFKSLLPQTLTSIGVSERIETAPKEIEADQDLISSKKASAKEKLGGLM